MPERNSQFTPIPVASVAPEATAPIAWWVRVVVVLGALLLATGAVLALVNPAMLVAPQDEINGAVHIYAGYLASRNLALAIMLVAVLSLGAKRALGNVMVLVALVQLLDVCMNCAEGRWTLVPGVFIFGLLFLIGAARLSGYPFWRSSFWTQ